MRLCRSIILALVGVLCASPATGQTRFTWPDTEVDFSSYTTVEECYAAVSRTYELHAIGALRAGGVWRDTLVFDPVEHRESAPAAAVDAAQRCLQRLADIDSLQLDRFHLLLSLYLVAGWEDRASALVERRVASVAPGDESELATVVGMAVAIYSAAPPWQGFVKPARGERAYEIAKEYLPAVTDRVQRYKIYSELLLTISEMADAWPDTALAVELVTRATTIADSLTAAERDSVLALGGVMDLLTPDGDPAQLLHLIYNMSFGRTAFLDSLRQSTGAFVRLKRESWARALGRPPETYAWGMPIGESAQPIEADFWLGRDDDGGARPRPGRISLIVFLEDAECLGYVRATDETMYTPAECAGPIFGLRRLGDRFPELDVTVVARTRGHFKYLKEGVTPEREAELVKRWLESFGIHAPLAMVVTDAWRLPGPDGRRIAPDDINRTNYSFGGTWQLHEIIHAFLIDQDGVIVHAGALNRRYAAEFKELIEILFDRMRPGV